MRDIEKIQWPGWKTVRVIGQGSYGAVYEIERDLFGQTEKAALKHIGIPQNPSDIDEMYNDGFDEESITATFQNHLKCIVEEYSIMRKLNGAANVVNCDDVRYIQRDDGIGWDIFIKMELLTPLAKALPDPIPVETTVKVGEDICRALILCRRFDIIHRDIKPQNIFVSPLGDYKLGDFGIAKTVEKTMGGTKTGTYKYMAPEVYNNQPYGQQVDIYSLGLVLYWMLNKRRMPFMPLPPEKLTAGMDEQTRSRRLAGEPLPPPADGSAELKRIVLKACAFDQKERYRTAEEMLEDLENLNCAAPKQGAGSGMVDQADPLEPVQEDCGTIGKAVFGAAGKVDSKVGDQTVSKPEDERIPDAAETVGAFRTHVQRKTAEEAAEEDKTVGILSTHSEDVPPHTEKKPETKPKTGKRVEAAEKKQTEEPQKPQKPCESKQKKARWILPAILGAAAIIGLLVWKPWAKPAGTNSGNSSIVETEARPSSQTSRFDTKPQNSAISTQVPQRDSTEANPEHTLAETPAWKAPEPGIHKYEYVKDNCTWEEARENAVERGGHLACFETWEEYEYVLKDIAEKAPNLSYLRIGARRDPDGTEYYWVDQNNQFFGECLNSAQSWCVPVWADGDPTFSWKGSVEDRCIISYNWDLRKWVLNDIGNEVVQSLNQDMIGYIIEYEP